MLRVAALLALPVAAPIPEGRPEQLIIWSAPLNWAEHGARLGAGAGVWTPDGKHVLTAGWAKPTADGPQVGEVRVWDVATGKHLRSFRGSATNYFFWGGTLAVSPDGKTVAAGGRRDTVGPDGRTREHLVEVWDWSAEQPRATLGGFECFVCGVTFSPDGRRLLAIDHREGNLRGWDMATGRPAVRAAVAPSWGLGLAHHPRHPILVGPDWDGDVLMLDANTGKSLATALKRRTEGGFMSAAFAPDGRTLACGVAEYEAGPPLVVVPLRVSEAGTVSTGEPVASSDKDIGCVYRLAYSPDGKLIAAACQDKTVRLYDADTARLLAVGREHTDFVYSVAFSPDGRRLLSVGRDAVKVWSVAELRNRRPAP